MFHIFVETSDRHLIYNQFLCNFVVIIQANFICKSGVGERGDSDYLFFVFYVSINLTF